MTQEAGTGEERGRGMKKAAIVLAMVLMVSTGCALRYHDDATYTDGSRKQVDLVAGERHVEWLGMPVFVKLTKGFMAIRDSNGSRYPIDYFRDDIEIGLRDGGVVVWRKVER